jgi:hypothetical protein
LRLRFGLGWRLLAWCLLSRTGACRNSTSDFRFDNKICVAADQKQMFDIVATNKDKPAAVVDRDAIDNSQSRGPASAATSQSCAVVSAKDQVADTDQDEYENEDYKKLGHNRSAFAEYRFQHLTHSASPSCTATTDAVVVRNEPARRLNSQRRQIRRFVDSAWHRIKKFDA